LVEQLTNIGGIPAAIVDEHNESYQHWQAAGIKDASVLHVDAHSDMSTGCFPIENFNLGDSLDYYKSLGISNFLCAAVYNDIISNLYWFNPHSDSMRLQRMGDEAMLDRGDGSIIWKRLLGLHSSGRKNIASETMELEDPFILDIDLDGFCCNNGIHNKTDDPNYDGVNGYEGRVDSMIELLRGRIRPQLITICRSVAPYDAGTFMPAEKVDEVQLYTINKLKELFN